jgi:hypothetical protein
MTVDLHFFSSSVIWSWKFSSVLFRCISADFFKRNSVRVVGDVMQS